MLSFLKLIRLPNLLVVLLTQWLVFHQLILPAFRRYGISAQLEQWEFWLIGLACVLVTAAGYIINDILDAKGDAINRPGTNPVYRIGESVCRFLYFGCVLLGYGISLMLAITNGQQSLLWLYPLITALLALYSRYIKVLPLLGNLLVSLLCAGVPAIIIIAERLGLKQLWTYEPKILRILFVYGCFAFLSTFLREVIKDMEDQKGDQLLGRRTLPLVVGESVTKGIAILLVLANIIAIASPYILAWPAFNGGPIRSILFLLLLTFAATGYFILRAKTSGDYGRISSGIKWMMLLGIALLAAL